MVFQFYVFCASVLVLLVAALLKTQSSLMKCLKECETKYRKLAEQSGNAILDIAADGSVRYASPSIKGLTGVDTAVLSAPTLAQWPCQGCRDHLELAFSR